MAAPNPGATRFKLSFFYPKISQDEDASRNKLSL
jgi:hypothetical protein